MTITAVAARTESYSNSTQTTLAFASGAAVGDLVIVTADVTDATTTLTGVSCDKAGSWTQVCAPLYDATVGNSQSMWKGVVNATGAGTLTFTYSAAIGTIGVQRVYQVFHSSNGAATTWVVEASNEQVNAAATTATYPTLTAGGTARLYFGLAAFASSGAAGSTTGGWVWQTDTYLDEILYNLSVGSGSVVPPTSGSGTSQKSVTLGAIFADTVPAPATPQPAISPYNSFH